MADLQLPESRLPIIMHILYSLGNRENEKPICKDFIIPAFRFFSLATAAGGIRDFNQ